MWARTHIRADVRGRVGHEHQARRALGDAQPAGAVAKPRRALADAEPTQVVAPLAILVPCALLVLMQLYLAIPLAPIVGEALGSDGAAAALGTAYSLAYALGLIIFGPLSDRYGRKPVLIPGMVALAIATAALSFASSMTMVGVLRAIQGLFAASFAAVTLAYVGEALPRRWRSTGIGAVATAFLVAGIVGQVYAQAVADALGWQWVFGLAAPAFALAAVGLGTILVEPALRRAPSSLGQEYRELATLARQRQMALPYLALFTILLSFVAMYAALGPWLVTRFGLDSADVLLVRLAGLPSMVLAPLAGWLAGRFGAARVSIAGFGVAAAGLVLEAVTAGTPVAAGRCQRHLRGRHRDRRPGDDRPGRQPGGPGAWRGARARRACAVRRSLLRPARTWAADRFLWATPRPRRAPPCGGGTDRAQQPPHRASLRNCRRTTRKLSKTCRLPTVFGRRRPEEGYSPSTTS